MQQFRKPELAWGSQRKPEGGTIKLAPEEEENKREVSADRNAPRWGGARPWKEGKGLCGWSAGCEGVGEAEREDDKKVSRAAR